MVNISLASIALAASVAFYVIMSDVMAERVIIVYVPMWYCDGWDGARYPTEKSMRSAFK